MALVSYDSSDCSDLDDGSNEKALPGQVPCESECMKASSSRSLNVDTDTEENCLSLFQSLPKPINQFHKEIKEEDDEFLHKHEAVKKEKTKIYIPSFSEFKDVEDISVSKKPYQASGKKCGLLSILPEPKLSEGLRNMSKPLIPNVVERKITELNLSPPIKKPVVIGDSSILKTIKRSGLHTSSDSDEGDQDDKETSLDFFSIYSQQLEIIPETVSIDVVDKNDTSTEITTVTFKDRSMSNLSEARHSRVENNDSAQNSGIDNSQLPDIESRQISDIELDDEALRQLCGSRKRHKKEDIEVITVDQQQVLSDSREWLVKGLMDDTSKRVSASKKRGNEPTNQQKRKHQITYLAHQAKANEAELQNQWANNRMSKRQTQSKYGF